MAMEDSVCILMLAKVNLITSGSAKFQHNLKAIICGDV